MINQSYPKATYSFEVVGNFFLNPLPPKVVKSIFDIVVVSKKIVHNWNLMQNKILVNLTYFAGL